MSEPAIIVAIWPLLVAPAAAFLCRRWDNALALAAVFYIAGQIFFDAIGLQGATVTADGFVDGIFTAIFVVIALFDDPGVARHELGKLVVALAEPLGRLILVWLITLGFWFLARQARKRRPQPSREERERAAKLSRGELP